MMLLFKTATLSLLSLVFFLDRNADSTAPPQNGNGLVMSESVKPVIEKKCAGCHSADSKNEKAKEKLIWANLSSMDNKAAASILDEVVEVVEKGEMPPAKFLERFPDNKLTEKESKAIAKWADKSAGKLLKAAK
jgi:uncharacterized membrane protein